MHTLKFEKKKKKIKNIVQFYLKKIECNSLILNLIKLAECKIQQSCVCLGSAEKHFSVVSHVFQWVPCIVHKTRKYFFSKSNFKTRFYGNIHIFKKCFQFSAISGV